MAVGLVGCSKSIDKIDDSFSVSFNIKPCDVFDEESVGARTRTSIVDGSTSFLWAQNDTVGIYPNTGSQVYFSLQLNNDASSADFDGGGWEFKSSSVYYSYYPFIGNFYLKRNHIPVSYLGQKQTGTTDFSNIGPFDFMYTPGTTVQSGYLNFTYHRLGCFIRLRIVLPAGTYTKLAITAPDESFITKGYFDLTSNSPAIIPTNYSNQLTVDLESITSNGSEFVVYVLCAPTDLRNKGFIVSVLNSERKEYQCTKTTSNQFVANGLYRFGCTNFTEVPQSMGLIINDWGDGDEIGGDAN